MPTRAVPNDRQRENIVATKRLPLEIVRRGTSVQSGYGEMAKQFDRALLSSSMEVEYIFPNKYHLRSLYLANVIQIILRVHI